MGLFLFFLFWFVYEELFIREKALLIRNITSQTPKIGNFF